MSTDVGRAREFCDGCHIGSLQPHRATYTRWHEGDLVVVPRMLAWRCDFCGETFFDDEALIRLALLLGTESDMEDQKHRRGRGLEGGPEEGLADRHRV